MVDLALRADGETVRARNTIDKLMVVMLRHLVPLDSLEQMNGESLFVYAVDQGWIGTAGVINSDIGDVIVAGTHACANALSGGEETSLRWVFQKENGEWKQDLTSVMPAADQALTQITRETEVNEDEFLTGLIESISGKKVPDSVWGPRLDSHP